MNFEEISKINEHKLKENVYPGRGIIIGVSPDGKKYYQVYWIMGRSENSRNRIFEQEGMFVKTSPFDSNKVVDPSLIIYYPVKSFDNIHIVSNGDQTDTLYDYIKEGNTIEKALFNRCFEPDAPNYTPRITGIVDMQADNYRYMLSILKTENNNGEYCERQFFYYDKAIQGFGHCLHTYNGDGNPIPSFHGEPYLVKLFNDIDEVLDYYWNMLNEDNKISILVKEIDKDSKDLKIVIRNKLKDN